jgi:pimeloyl-ACP methyl ester carboxylesterase
MNRMLTLSATALLAACATLEEAASPVFEPYTLKGPNGAEVGGEIATLEVPEYRADPASRRIKLRFVRLPSTAVDPGDPVVYLAGGPGGSAVGAAQSPRHAFFNRLREVGDVILFEQRGTGLSDALPVCEAAPFDAGRTLDRANFVAAYRKGFEQCLAFWRASGADIRGYTTAESAADLEDLRIALNAKRLNLVGISYGTHLGMGALKRRLPVGRAAFTGLEGLDQTVKRPAHFDAFLARVAASLEESPAASAYPDLLAMMRRVHARLDREPAVIRVAGPDGAQSEARIGLFPIQMLTAFLYIADPVRIARLPEPYARMDRGDFQSAGETIYGAALQEFGRMRGMPELMDHASGVSPRQQALVRAEAATALLGDAGNFPMPHIADLAPDLVLPDEFRRPLSTAVPVLIVTGTMDGRTPIESQEEVLSQFRRATRLVVVNGGHNIFEQSEAAQEEIVRFLKTGRISTGETKLPPPAFVAPAAR